MIKGGRGDTGRRSKISSTSMKIGERRNGTKIEGSFVPSGAGFANFLRKRSDDPPIEPAADASRRSIYCRERRRVGLSFFPSAPFNKHEPRTTKETENRHVGGERLRCLQGKSREEDEDVSMPRPNKIEIFVDENRMSPRWKKGQETRRKKKHKGCVYI